MQIYTDTEQTKSEIKQKEQTKSEIKQKILSSEILDSNFQQNLLNYDVYCNLFLKDTLSCSFSAALAGMTDR